MRKNMPASQWRPAQFFFPPPPSSSSFVFFSLSLPPFLLYTAAALDGKALCVNRSNFKREPHVCDCVLKDEVAVGQRRKCWLDILMSLMNDIRCLMKIMFWWCYHLNNGDMMSLMMIFMMIMTIMMIIINGAMMICIWVIIMMNYELMTISRNHVMMVCWWYDNMMIWWRYDEDMIFKGKRLWVRQWREFRGQ